MTEGDEVAPPGPSGPAAPVIARLVRALGVAAAEPTGTGVAAASARQTRTPTIVKARITTIANPATARPLGRTRTDRRPNGAEKTRCLSPPLSRWRP